MTYLVLISVMLCSAALCQQPPTPAETTKPAVIEGQIVNARTGEPVRRAAVSLRPLPASGMVGIIMPAGGPSTSPYAATTNAEGRFRIDAVDPGDYQLMAERQGFVRQLYGARGSFMSGATIKVAAGQQLKLDFKMTPQAIITGRVLDEEGEPLARVQIQVLRRQYLRGKPQMLPVGGGQTSDTGEFRVADLRPGRYLVSAAPYGQIRMFNEGPARNTANKPEEEYVITYHPSTAEQADARSLEVTAGQELSGIDIRMLKARVYRVRGKVTGAARPPMSTRLMIVPRDRAAVGFFGGGGTVLREDGTFEFGGVQPGSYYVAALSMQGGQGVLGKAPVDVARENVENLSLTLAAGATWNGSIRVDGDVRQLEQAQGKKITFAAVRVQLSPVEGVLFDSPGTNAKEDGSFALENVGAGRYRVYAYNLPRGTWLKAVRAGDQDVPDTGIDLSGGVPGNLQLVLGLGVGSITGVVQDAKQQPAFGSIITLLPDPMKEERSYLSRITTAGQDGQFTIAEIPPGDYKLFAWEDLEPGRHTDPEFLQAHDTQAYKITVKPDGRHQVSLSQIPAEPVTK